MEKRIYKKFVGSRYSWCGAQLFEDGAGQSEGLTPEDLLPLETANDFRSGMEHQWRPRVVIGHNVGFDRSFIREQYYVMVNSVILNARGFICLCRLLLTCDLAKMSLILF